MKDNYIFPAIFSVESDGVSVEFPDLPGCLTCGDTEEEALFMAKDALHLHIYGMEQDGDPIPEPSKIKDLKLEESQFVAVIEAWMVPYRDKMANKAEKITLTLPKWLKDLGEQRKVNFSHILQKGLKDFLGVAELTAKKETGAVKIRSVKRIAPKVNLSGRTKKFKRI
jgi:predicted RNase H-like HicB family nuclease